LTACDTVLIPLQTEFFALLGISQLVDTINLIKQSVNPNISIEGVILTMLDKRTHLTDDVIKNTIRHFGNKVYKTMIPRNVKVAESPSFGIPVLVHDRTCVGSKAYIDLAREIIHGEK
jgi:chromosome partitioning protein